VSVAGGTSAHGGAPDRQGVLARWMRRRRAMQRNVDHAVWNLRERYGEAALRIADASARAPAGLMRRRFWRKVAARLKLLG
jgi:hypothetical protein